MMLETSGTVDEVVKQRRALSKGRQLLMKVDHKRGFQGFPGRTRSGHGWAMSLVNMIHSDDSNAKIEKLTWHARLFMTHIAQRCSFRLSALRVLTERERLNIR